jgi:hypothetical protein
VAEHAQLFPVFHCFETAFRSTVAVTLERHYRHARWWRGIYEAMKRGDKSKSVTRIGAAVVTRHAAYRIGQIVSAIEGEPFHRNVINSLNNGYEFLEECDLAHTLQLIECNWSVFSSLFSGQLPLTQKDFSAKFDKVRDARNDVYHHKSVANRPDAVAAAEELLDRLGFSLGFVCREIQAASPTRLTFAIPRRPRGPAA